MAATMRQVAEELKQLGYATEFVPVDRKDPEGRQLLNVYDEPAARYPAASVLAPHGEDGWVWGHHWEWGIEADADANAVAARISATVAAQEK